MCNSSPEEIELAVVTTLVKEVDKLVGRRIKIAFTNHRECQKVVVDDQKDHFTIKELLDSVFSICQVSYFIKSTRINYQIQHVALYLLSTLPPHTSLIAILIF